MSNITRTPSLQRYLSELDSNIMPLSVRDERICINYPLALTIAMQHAQQGADLEDLFAAAMLGLCIAADKFDPATGHTFSTFAVPWIRGEVMNQLRQIRNTVHITRKELSLHRAVEREKEKFLAANGYEPDIDDIAEILMVSPESVESVWNGIAQMTSLDDTVGGEEDDQFTLADVLPDNVNDHVELISDLLSRLSIQERQIIERHFINEEDYRTIARDFNLTAERVRQIAMKAIARCKA